MNSEIDARQAALKRLAVREYSAVEMQAYLEKKGYSESEAQTAIKDLVVEGSLSDQRYIAAVTKTLALRGKGPLYIVNWLRQRGVTAQPDAIRAILAEYLNEDEVTSARKIIERRYPKLSRDPKERQRAFQALLRRGFSSTVAARVLRQISSNDQGDGSSGE